MIIVMGLPGAGKTTVLGTLKGKRQDYKFLNYGDLMLEIEREKGWVVTRDEMRKLPVEKQKIAQGLVAKALSKEKDKIILDTHCSISTPSGYFPGLPFDFLKNLKVDALVYVTADPDEIHKRRKKDLNRVRDEEPLGHIIEHDNINRYYLAAYSAFTGAPAVIVYNKEGGIDETVLKVGNILK